MNKYVYLLITSCFIFLITSCESNKWYQIPNEAYEYVERFEDDASLHGYDIEIEEQGLIIEIKDNELVNKSELYYEDPLHIIINQQIWNEQNCDNKQLLLYKDLAQGFLNRLNKDDLLENGEFASIMRSEETDQEANINFFGFRKNYYISELFQPETKAPWWSDYTLCYDSINFTTSEFIISEETPNDQLNWKYNNDNISINSIGSEIEIENNSDQNLQVLTDIDLTAHSDFMLECIIKTDISSQGECNGLIWGANNFSDWYFCGYNPDNEIVLYNNKENHTYYNFTSNTNEKVIPNGYNKISLLKKDDLIFFFINEKFIYFTDFHGMYGNDAGFYIGAHSRIYINRLELETNPQ